MKTFGNHMTGAFGAVCFGCSVLTATVGTSRIFYFIFWQKNTLIWLFFSSLCMTKQTNNHMTFCL
uniref:Uncharacterized protein n=1 Tax=Anguilla anguilla TaxID=7936 RepID=A0A0E9WKZ1_ANGAN